MPTEHVPALHQKEGVVAMWRLLHLQMSETLHWLLLNITRESPLEAPLCSLAVEKVLHSSLSPSTQRM